MDRLVFNTPGRMGGSGKDPEVGVLFTLLFMAFLVFFVLAFLVWFLLNPERGSRVVGDLRGRISVEQKVDEREWQLFFADEPGANSVSSGSLESGAGTDPVEVSDASKKTETQKKHSERKRP